MMRVPKPALAAAAMLYAVHGASAQTPSVAAADDGPQHPPLYRVELVVFAHADGDSDRRRSPTPIVFDGALDPLLVARAHRSADAAVSALRELLPMLPRPREAGEFTPYVEADEVRLRPIPPAYAALDGLSTTMRGVVERLDASAGYQPLVARAWMQPAQPRGPTAALRIHDDVVVAMRAPDSGQPPPFFPRRLSLPAGTDDEQRPVMEPLLGETPPPQQVFRLDGSAKLSRRQFLHLDVSLVWQQRARAVPRGPAASGAADRSEPEAAAEWRLHRLDQSRVVQPGRVEYFDSSRFGVLVLVERFARVVPEPPAPPAASAADDPRPSVPTDGG